MRAAGSTLENLEDVVGSLEEEKSNATNREAQRLNNLKTIVK